MGETIGDAAAAPRAKPTILVPPRGLIFASGSGPGFSPGPMTLVSSLFPEQGAFSFSQLLAGAMASPQPEGLSRPLFVVPPGLGSTGSLNSPGYLSPLQSPFGMSHQQALAHVTAQAALSQSFKQMQAEFFNQSSSKDSANTSTLQTNPLPSEPDTPKLESSEISQLDKKTVGDKPTNDGYNWRKYGQKHVKASEFPRSYYKCTHLNCPVKKKVERSLDGRVSEITYKGEHNHDPPNKANKWGKDSNVLDTTNVTSQCLSETDRLKEALPVHSESADFETNTKDSSDNYDKEDTAIIVENGDDDEPNAKRRSLDTGPSVPVTSHKSLSDSKIVLQTRSQVDLLDDGYKWRKYGQKVVKGNPYPRSYYRCTYSGCNVRKHVERASADPTAVITTYEGKHNHDIPSQQSKTQKTVSKNPSFDKETDLGKNDHMPMTLQLKEQIAA